MSNVRYARQEIENKLANLRTARRSLGRGQASEIPRLDATIAEYEARVAALKAAEQAAGLDRA